MLGGASGVERSQMVSANLKIVETHHGTDIATKSLLYFASFKSLKDIEFFDLALLLGAVTLHQHNILTYLERTSVLPCPQQIQPTKLE